MYRGSGEQFEETFSQRFGTLNSILLAIVLLPCGTSVRRLLEQPELTWEGDLPWRGAAAADTGPALAEVVRWPRTLQGHRVLGSWCPFILESWCPRVLGSWLLLFWFPVLVSWTSLASGRHKGCCNIPDMVVLILRGCRCGALVSQCLAATHIPRPPWCLPSSSGSNSVVLPPLSQGLGGLCST